MTTHAESLNIAPVSEVPLPDTPLLAVVAQVRFPTILAIRQADDAQVASFQTKIRDAYPYLNQHHSYQIDAAGVKEPQILRTVVWRFSDLKTNPHWRISLGDHFVALETRKYTSRQDFLERLGFVLTAVGDVLAPASATRLGIRYIDRLTGKTVDDIDNFLIPDIVGVARRHGNQANVIAPSIMNLMTHAQLQGPGSNVVAARWGILPPNETYDPDLISPTDETSWILDMDMFTTMPCNFFARDLLRTATEFAEDLYKLFRHVVTDDFLKHYGGKV